MATRHTATISLLVLTLGAGCYDPEDEEVQPLPGPIAEGETSDEGSEDDADDGDDRGEDDDGQDDDGEDDADSSEPPPSNDSGPTCEAEIGEPCETHGNCCDYESGDALCVTDGVNTICHQTCTSGSECGSGCCGPVDSGESVCLPEVYCDACSDPGNTCTQNGDCCGFSDGEASCVNFTEGLYCSATCVWGSDCNSGCCVALDNGLGACAPDYYCGGDAPEQTELDEATSQSEPNASYDRVTSH